MSLSVYCCCGTAAIRQRNKAYLNTLKPAVDKDDHQKTNLKDKTVRRPNSIFPFNLLTLKVLPKNKIACNTGPSNPDIIDGYDVDQENDKSDVVFSSIFGFVDQGDVDSIPCSFLDQDQEEQAIVENGDVDSVLSEHKDLEDNASSIIGNVSLIYI
jgi:hypothetical protein